VSQNRKTKLFNVDPSARAARRRARRTVTQANHLEAPNGASLTHNHEYETTLNDSEMREVIAEAAKFTFYFSFRLLPKSLGKGRTNHALRDGF
jgi:hypothetical protein